MKERILTGAGLTCTIAALLLLSGHLWFLKAVSVILSVLAAWELCRAGGAACEGKISDARSSQDLFQYGRA